MDTGTRAMVVGGVGQMLRIKKGCSRARVRYVHLPPLLGLLCAFPALAVLRSVLAFVMEVLGHVEKRGEGTANAWEDDSVFSDIAY